MQLEAPIENFSRGLLEIDFPELGERTQGKVRDMWTVNLRGKDHLVMVTTDRQSSGDKIVALTPGRGKILNQTSIWWFKETSDLSKNHFIRTTTHPNVMITQKAAERSPVEVIFREYMAKSGSPTSIYHNYADLGRRKIYGINFPDDLVANQHFPMGIILTPTTKAEQGEHDQELTDEEAQGLTDKKLGTGYWEKIVNAAIAVFARGRQRCLSKGIILVDTKYEFGVNERGEVMLIDEVHTPDSSRFWLAESYQERFLKGRDPENFDKEILRKWLREHGFTGKQEVPVIDASVLDQLGAAYQKLYETISGGVDIPETPSDPEIIRQSVLKYLNNPKP